ADRVGVGQRVVEREVVAGQEAHRGGAALGVLPDVHEAAVPRAVLAFPRVVGATVVLRALLRRRRLGAGERAGGQRPRVLGRGDRLARGGGRLLPDRQAAGELDRRLVAEALHAAQ